MATTINNVKVDFGLGAAPPRVTFLQGADMSITNIRDTLRQIEESEEGRDAVGAVTMAGTSSGWICRSGGNFQFSESESSALTVEILPPYDIFFESGATPFQSSSGSLLGTFVDSPGAIVQINNAIGATNLQSVDIQHASFDGGVHVDVTGSQTGAAYPSGNSANPVNNWADAVIINGVEGFDQYFVEKSATLDNTQDFTDASFVGKSIIDTVLTVPAGTTIDKAEFFNVSLEGALGQTTIMQNCFLGETNALDNVRGVIESCSIGPAKLTLGGASTSLVRFVNCRGAGSAFSPPTINCGGDGPEVDIQDYVGQLNIENKTGEAVFEISITGKLTLDATCTAGVVIINGSGTFVNNSSIPDSNIFNNMTQGIQLRELWQLQGLDELNPMTVTTTDRTIADQTISLGLTGDGVTTQTVTRQADQTITFNAPLISNLLDATETAVATFNRASIAKYLDTGTALLTDAAIDTTRFEAGGLLIEGTSENLATRSEVFSFWSTQSCTTDTDVGVAPDGLTAADRLNVTAADATHILFKSQSAASDTYHTASVFLKDDGAGFGALMFGSSAADHATAVINLATGVVTDTKVGTNSGTILETGSIDVGDGWWRLWLTAKVTLPTPHLMIASSNSGTPTYAFGRPKYLGVEGEDILVWGAGLELDTLSSYITTGASSATRSADFLSYDTDTIITDFAGSILIKVTPQFGVASPVNGVILNVIDQLVGPLYFLDDSGTTKFASGDGTNVAKFDASIIAGNIYHVGVRWSTTLNELQIVVNGTAGSIVPYDGAFARSGGKLLVGSGITGNHAFSHLKEIRAFNSDKGETFLRAQTS